ncbi:MAG: hypothetical protein CMF46_05420 [Legionellales bacterium]|nr:hypothetical protein [Legionellales bacterium]
MSKKASNRLGKKAILDLGLSELLSSCNPDPDNHSTVQPNIQVVGPEQLVPSPYQQRRQFCPKGISELAATLSEQGILQPLVVRHNGSHYEIIAGERRWRAAKQANLTEIPVIVRELNNDQAMVIGLIENLQREDLNIVDQALGIQSLVTDFALTHSQVSEKIGLSRQSVSNMLRLLQLHSEVLQALRDGHIQFGHARCLITLPEADQINATHTIIRNQWSVRQLETWLSAKKINNTPIPVQDFNLSVTGQAVLDRLSNTMKYFSSKVRLSQKRNQPGGSLIIEFKHTDDLENLLQHFGTTVEEARDTKL